MVFHLDILTPFETTYRGHWELQIFQFFGISGIQFSDIT